MQNSKITMKELLYKMACYQELYPNVHLFEKDLLRIEHIDKVNVNKQLHKD